MLVVTALLVGFMLIGSLLFYAWMYRQITAPIKAMQQTITEIEQTGQLSKRVVVHSKDEVGQTSVVFNNLMDTMQATLSQVSRVVEGLAVGDFSRKVDADLKGDLLVLKEGVNSSVENIQATMSGLNSVMESFSKGDFSKRIHLNMNGEFKVSLDLATQAMQTLENVLGQVDSVMNQVANSNLSGRISAKALGQLDSLTKNMNSSLEALSNAMRLVNRNAQLVATSANETSTAIGQISDGAQNQMHSIADVLNAVKQTSESVTDVAKHTNQASQQSKDAILLMDQGMQKMNDMIQVVNSIAINSEKISKITETIEGIANKTNLLSLNAAIEAARAGEHGKGFSVVAEEVGKLASNSAQSSQEIAQLVQQAVHDARLAVTTAESVSEGMYSIQTKTTETDMMLASISAALEQQSSSVSQISHNVGGLDRIARSNAAAAEEITATVIELAQIADSTRREVEKFAV
jgi:methyl-accepting chemotaxis protein